MHHCSRQCSSSTTNPRISLEFAGLRLDELEIDPGFAKFDLTLEVYELNGLCFAWEYNADQFDHSRIVRMAEHFETLLPGICADPRRKLSELPILSAAEQNRTLVECGTQASLHSRRRLHL